MLIYNIKEVGELVVAPSMTESALEAVMDPTIIAYLDKRCDATRTLGMETPKPKHHFLAHCAKDYLRFGPLISIWAMRMESKHTYMKRVIRSAKNFINPPKTCATRHQRALVSHQYLGLFPTLNVVLPAKNVTTARDLLQVPHTLSAAENVFLKYVGPKAIITTQVTFKNTERTSWG